MLEIDKLRAPTMVLFFLGNTGVDDSRLKWGSGFRTEEGHDFGHGVLLCRRADGGNVVAMVGRGDVVVVAHVSGEEGAVVSESWFLEHGRAKVWF